jgi:tetratricopeptide (TPR) repeat protein
MYSQEQWFDRAHDIVFDWLVAGGVLGFLAYIGMFGATVYLLWKDKTIPTYERSILTGLLAGYFFNNIFVFDNITSYIMFFIVMSYVQYRSVVGTKVERKKIELPVQYAVISIVIVAGIFSLYMYNYKAIAASGTLIEALSQGSGREAQSLDLFKKVFAYKTLGESEAREQLFTVASQVVQTDAATSTKQDFVNYAIEQSKEQLDETPNDARYYLFAGNLYQRIGGISQSIPYLEKAVQLSPNKQSILFALGSSYFSVNEVDKALDVFKRAYELEPSFDEAKKLYALVALYAGKDAITKNLYGNTPVMDPRFVTAYRDTKHYDLMIAYLQKNVEANPNQAQSYFELADGYIVANNKTEAIKVLQKVMTLTTDPSAQKQLQQAIDQIKAGKNPFQAQ